MNYSLTPSQQAWVDQTLSSLSLEAKIAQLLCPNFRDVTKVDDIRRLYAKHPCGSLFTYPSPAKPTAALISAVNRDAPVPILGVKDLVFAAGESLLGCTQFVFSMAVGAANSAPLAAKIARAIAREGAAHNIRWTLGPTVDICHNPRSCIVGFRSYSQSPRHVARLAEAHVRALQHGSLMAATAKHFPGDGVDERDHHYCTSVNSLSREAWFDSYGQVWSAVIAQGVQSVMLGHIALPFVDPGSPRSHLGPPPASLSRKIMVDFLRGELGFQGVLVSDAMDMQGLLQHVPRASAGAEFIRAGGDVVLFARPQEDHAAILDYVRRRLIPESRVDESARRVLAMKARLGVADSVSPPVTLSREDLARHASLADQVASRSVKIVRNADHTIPLHLPKGSRVLAFNFEFSSRHHGWSSLSDITPELRRRGLRVSSITVTIDQPAPPELKLLDHSFDAIFVNLNVGVHDRWGFNTLPFSFQELLAKLCRPSDNGRKHCPIVFTSFADPFKIVELPYVPNMINTFSPCPPSQRAAVRVWLGEDRPRAKNPCSAPGYFDMEVPV